MSLRSTIKDATCRNFWLRYLTLVPWRLSYALYSSLTLRNISGEEKDLQGETHQQYAARIFQNYRNQAGVSRFHGRVAEVGPGRFSAIAKMFIADGCKSVDQVDRFRYEDPEPSPAVRRFLEPAETFFKANRGYDFIVSCAVLEHLSAPLGTIRAMTAALNPGGVMIHSVDCRDHGQFSSHLHDLSFLRISPELYWPMTLATGIAYQRTFLRFRDQM